MKNSKIISAFCATTLLMTCFSFSLSAKAADEKLSFIYNESESTSTSAVIDVVVSDDTALVYSIQFGLTTADATISSATYTETGTLTATCNKLSDRVSINAYGEYLVSNSGTKIGKITLNFSEALTKDAVISLTNPTSSLNSEYIAFENEDYTGDIYLDASVINASTITVKYNPNEEPVEPDTTPYVPEELEKTRFDAHTNAVPVDAWSTTIDYSTTAVEGTLTWVISNGEKSAKVAAATVSGEPTVVYGLFIAGQAAELDTIKSVQLVAETVVE